MPTTDPYGTYSQGGQQTYEDLDPNASSYYKWVLNRANSKKAGSLAISDAIGGLAPSAPYTGRALKMGMANFVSNLANQGHIDPRTMNMERSGLARSTADAVRSARTGFATRGFGNSGVGAAIEAAMQSAGDQSESDRVSKESADAAERNRQDIGMLPQLAIQPSIDQLALAMGQYNNNANRSQQQKGATLSAIGKIIGAILGH